MNFGPDAQIQEIMSGLEMVFYGAAFALAFAAGWITGGICQR